jgi:hypothetical protein
MRNFNKLKSILLIGIGFSLVFLGATPVMAYSTYTAWEKVQYDNEAKVYGGAQFNIRIETLKDLFYEVSSSGTAEDGGTDIPVYFEVDAWRERHDNGACPGFFCVYNNYWVPSKIEFNVYIANIYEHSWSDLDKLRRLITLKDVSLSNALDTGFDTTKSYTLGANIGFSGKVVKAGVNVGMRWTTSWKGLDGIPSQENADQPAFAFINGFYYIFPRIYYGIRIAQWDFDFKEKRTSEYVNLAGAFIFTIDNQEAHAWKYDRFRIFIDVTVYYSEWDLFMFWWYKNTDYDYYTKRFTLGDGVIDKSRIKSHFDNYRYHHSAMDPEKDNTIGSDANMYLLQHVIQSGTPPPERGWNMPW